jgi:hypothetical protein
MKQRCKRDKNYAGLVTYAPEWKSFPAFLEDMGDCPEGYSLDRKNPFEGYSKANCRWAPRDVQASNKKKAGLLRYDWAQEGATWKPHGGAVGTVAEWSWYLRRVTGSNSWSTDRLREVLCVLPIDQILRAASPWGIPPEELSFMAGPDFSSMWADYLNTVYLQAV